ncbi:MAG: ribose-phosphate pyrophosphokinase [Nanoarchaeota archaeon]|nr:ribose-phosphate pyrophosphokinase [Nanoarchaeota archaeon]
MTENITLISGSSNPEFAKKVSECLGVPLTPIETKRFNDGETYAHILESVRGHHVFVIHSTSPPVNDTLMELLIVVDALKRASAKEITAVIPYFGYARQDRKARSREPITAKLVASLIERAGVDRVVTFDLHVDQIQGFFDIPVDNLEAMPILAKPLSAIKDLTIVSPDVGGAKRARRLAKDLDAPIALIDKRRPAHGKVETVNVIGDVKGRNCIIIDDIIDSGGTMANAARELKKRGAKDIILCATHAVLSGAAKQNLSEKAIKEVIVADTIHISKEKMLPKIKVVSLAQFTAELITSIFKGAPMGVIVRGKHEQVSKREYTEENA